MSREENTLEIEVQCPECKGEGYHEVGPECDRPASMCCGGCYTRQLCEECDGGEVTLTFTEEEAVGLIEDIIYGNIDNARDFINDQHHEICQRQ